MDHSAKSVGADRSLGQADDGALLSTSRYQSVTLRAGRMWHLIPGEIAVVRPRKQWNYAGTAYLSGLIDSTRMDARALGLLPLKLEDQGNWDPAEEYWEEPGEPIDKWAKPIIARGPRRQFEMEQILPGADADDPFSDPITESNDQRDAGDIEGARKILMGLCHSDLRCLDAHAHLANLVFDGQITLFGTMRLDFGLANYHCEPGLTEHCPGAGSIIGDSCVACMDSDYVFALRPLRRSHVYF